MFLILGNPKNISDLKGENPKDIKKLRKNIPILVIDDEGFLYADILKTHGFDIHVVADIDSINLVDPYPIIICDITGVGKRFESRYEGAHVIQEIKKLYPFKIVIAFTGKTFDASYNKYFAMSDRVVRKDSDLDFWVEALDKAINEFVDPIKLWEKIRGILLDHEISLKRLLQLEDHFVTRCLDQREPFVDDPRMVKKLPAEVRGAIIGVATKLISKYVFRV